MVILTALLSAAALFIIAKLLGHKQVAQLDFFDYVTGITIGSIAAELATELEEPLKPLIAMAVYGVFSFVLTFISHKFPKSRKFVNGTPTILMDNGKLYRKNMKKAKLDLSWLDKQLKSQKCKSAKEVYLGICDQNNKLSLYFND